MQIQVKGRRLALSRERMKEKFQRDSGHVVRYASSVAFLAIGLTVTKTALAQAFWDEQNGDYNGGPGCATAIAVGANNWPVVLGCGLGTSTIFYAHGESCSGLLCTPTWNRMEGLTTAAHVAVNLNGNIFATDTSGALWFANGSAAGDGGFTGGFTKISTTYFGGTACIQSLAAPFGQSDPPSVTFVNPIAQTGTLSTFWGVGCGGSPNESLWTLPLDAVFGLGKPIIDGSSEWQQVGAAEGNAAAQVALFTDVNENAINQNPWVVANGNVYFYNGQYYQQEPNAPAGVTYVTDHYIVAGGNVYYWNGSAGGGGTTTWTEVIGPTPNAPINQIAWAQAVPGTQSGTVGPSQLWAIDTSGNIYFQMFASTPR